MRITDLLFPRRCVGCGKLGDYFCNKCLPQIEFITRPICPICIYPAIDGATHPTCLTPYALDGMYAVARYRGPMRKAISILKYKFVSDLASTLVDLFFLKFPKYLPSFDLFAPVPLHPWRERTRGFNQSALLAKSLGEKLNISVETNVLKRIRNTSPQVKLKGKKRRSNLQGAFVFHKASDISGKTIGLVDDVATTRSTLLECAKVLKRNGAKCVWGIVLAHG